MKGIFVQDGGFLTTVQDRGREGYQRCGVTVSGAIDRYSYTLANILVGNYHDEAILEATVTGPVLKFAAANVVAVTGADMSTRLNGVEMPMYAAVSANAGDVLSFGECNGGCRAYIAFAGGLDVPEIMGSRSTDIRAKIGGLEGRKLAAGDNIGFCAPTSRLHGLSSRKIVPQDFSASEIILRVILGPQDDYFSDKGIETFLTETYIVTPQNDRMGYRLEGMPIEFAKDGDIITDGTVPGAIQVAGDGKPIIMLADRPTTGGYAKIATVISVDIPLISQCVIGNRVRFAPSTVEEAEELLIEQLRRFDILKGKLDAGRPFIMNMDGNRCEVEAKQAEHAEK